MKTKLMIFSALTILSFVTLGQTITETKTQSTTGHEYFWQVQVNYDLPDLDAKAIQIGWMDSDPTAAFIQKFDMVYLTDQINKAKDEEEKKMQIIVGIDVTWNNMFSVVKGNELYLLTKSGMTLTRSGTQAQTKMKKWLVSKVFYLDSKPYAYAVSVDVENGSNLAITLNKTNLISLTDLYTKVKK